MMRAWGMLLLAAGLVLMGPVAMAATKVKSRMDVEPAIVKDDAPPPILLSRDQLSDLKRVEDYFNTMPTVSATFLQRSVRPSGQEEAARGTFRLWRPGRLRIDYNNKSHDFIVADGRAIYFWDGEMETQSQTGIDDTLPGVILRKDFSFSRDVTVTKVEHPTPQRLEIGVRSAKDPAAGELTLVINESPFRLTSWRIIDGQGLLTEVVLDNIRQGEAFDKKDFVFHRPESRRGVRR